MRNKLLEILKIASNIRSQARIETSIIDQNIKVYVSCYDEYRCVNFDSCSNVYIEVVNYSNGHEVYFIIDIYKEYFEIKISNKTTAFRNFENTCPFTEESWFQYSTINDTADLTIEEMNAIIDISLEIPLYEY